MGRKTIPQISAAILAPLLILILSFFIAGHLLIGNSIIPADEYSSLMPANFKVAFIGDQGLGINPASVLKLIRDEKADMVLHSGDFDYEDNPEKWDEQINNVLGKDFPYFASIGNHELNKWPEYQQKLKSRLERIEGAKCVGNLGVASACTYNRLFFILSGAGTKGYFGDASKFPFYAPWRFPYNAMTKPSQLLHSIYIKKQLESNNLTWKICSWHKNQELMQVGFKVNEVGWAAYEECRKSGAIIATGHHHSYSRTHLMSSFKAQKIASKSGTLQIGKGNAFAFVSGIAGESMYPQNDELAAKEWWATIYTATQDADHGALFCTFNLDGIDNKAHCYFKDISGKIADEFDLISEV